MALDFDSLTRDQLQQLAKLIQQSQLSSLQDAIDKQQGQALHEEKNAPWGPNGYYAKALKELPPSPVGREYPKMLYTADYQPAVDALVAARRFPDRKDPAGAQIRAAEQRVHGATMKVGSAAEERAALDSGLYGLTPADALHREEQRQQAIAQAAAESQWDDRRMSTQAQAERAQAEAESDGHLVEVPETPRRGPGRPKKDPAS